MSQRGPGEAANDGKIKETLGFLVSLCLHVGFLACRRSGGGGTMPFASYFTRFCASTGGGLVYL